MKKLISMVMVVSLLLSGNYLYSESLDFGADAVSRYVWRGSDFGNSPAIQPYISFTQGPLEIGAWGSWSVIGAAGGNENDLYAAFSFANFSLIITDYFFPGYTGDDMIDDFSDTGGHIIELSGSARFNKLNILAAMNVAGNDPDNSIYFEAGYEIYNHEELSAAVVAGAGNGFYTVDSELNLVNFGLSLSKDRYTAAYIINPDQKTSFLVFGISF